MPDIRDTSMISWDKWDKWDILYLLTLFMVKPLVRLNSCTDMPASTRPAERLSIWGHKVQINKLRAHKDMKSLGQVMVFQGDEDEVGRFCNLIRVDYRNSDLFPAHRQAAFSESLATLTASHNDTENSPASENIAA